MCLRRARCLPEQPERRSEVADLTTRYKRDERRGVQARIPNEIAQNLPDEGEFLWSGTDDGVLQAELVRIERRALKIRAPEPVEE